MRSPAARCICFDGCARDETGGRLVLALQHDSVKTRGRLRQHRGLGRNFAVVGGEAGPARPQVFVGVASSADVWGCCSSDVWGCCSSARPLMSGHAARLGMRAAYPRWHRDFGADSVVGGKGRRCWRQDSPGPPWDASRTAVATAVDPMLTLSYAFVLRRKKEERIQNKQINKL